jgi:hypothetical protein
VGAARGITTGQVRREVHLVIKSLLAAVTKGPGACLTAAIVLWQIITHVAPGDGTVYIHVVVSPSVVSVDGQERRVGSIRESPVVFDLPAGQHRLRLRRGDEFLDEYPFHLAREEEKVLTVTRPGPDRGD